MSIFSNRAAGAAAEADQYIAAVIDLLGQRAPLAVLAETAGVFESLVESTDPARLTQREGPGRWSVAMVLMHMADSELVWGYRLRMVLAHDRPELEGYDQDAWADLLGYEGADYRAAVKRFRALRDSHLAIFSGLAEDQWQRVSVHQERGEESLRHMTALYAGHDLVHRRQLDRILGG